MSGGHFDYNQYRIREIADEVERLIKTNNTDPAPEFGYYARSYSTETINLFKIALITLRTAEIYTRRIDWLVSGDDGEDDFHRRLNEDIAEYLKELHG